MARSEFTPGLAETGSFETPASGRESNIPVRIAKIVFCSASFKQLNAERRRSTFSIVLTFKEFEGGNPGLEPAEENRLGGSVIGCWSKPHRGDRQ